ncbi:MAG: penicillin-binding protein 2 [Desulfobacterales bacterium]|nr:penicillin-binding protein 2 [Desulfobacterales bacterium]
MSEYLNTAGSDWYKKRVTGVILWVIAAFVVLFLRLFYLQVLVGEEFRRISASNCIRLQGIEPPRGLIFDRNGLMLVDNRPSFDLSIVLKDARPVKRTIRKLSYYINSPERDFLDKVSNKRGFATYKPVLLKQDVGRNVLAAVEAHKFDLPGVHVNVKSRRQYIHKGSAAHLIGYIREIDAIELQSEKFVGYRGGDFIGKAGVEKVFESFLRGERGGRQVEVDARGQIIRVLKTVEAQPGANLYLTIDHELQALAESLLDGVTGAVVAMDPATGHILAMASNPSFDQNAFVDRITHKQWDAMMSNPFGVMQNKAVRGEYPPASTFKIVTAIAGLEEGVIDENTTIYCPGHFEYGDRTFRCWKKGGHGAVDINKAISESCDVYFYQVGLKLGVDRIARYAKAFGLGKRAGIELDHESPGLVPTAAWKKKRHGVPWQAGETLSISIGQGYNKTTPLQMLGVISAVANGGARCKPIILQEMRNFDNEVKTAGEPLVVGRLPDERKTLEKNMALVRQGLWEAVNGPRGTARRAARDGIDLCGKTGTAQVVGRRDGDDRFGRPLPDHLKDHAWFVAYAPADAPKIAAAVIVEHGEHGHVVSPIASLLIKAYLKPE